MSVPDNWDVRELGDLLEFVPPDESGAAQISVLRRSAAETRKPNEALRIAENFASKHDASAVVVEINSENQEAQVARLSFISEDEVGALSWDVTVLASQGLALVCTYCHDGADETNRQTARQMYESIRLAA